MLMRSWGDIMSSFGAQMRKRVKELQVLGDKLPKVISDCMEGAVVEAIKTATQSTPPNAGDLAGTNTRSGQMAQHWEDDSISKPKHTGNTYSCELNNNMKYASYVDKGHHMDKHFVPGLIVNGNMLERVDKDVGGIVVGTKTTYVKGLYITDKAIGKYRSTLRRNLDREAKKILE